MEGILSDCHREIQRRDQRLKSIQKTVFGIFCLFVGIVAYYYTNYHKENDPVVNRHQSDKDLDMTMPTKMCPVSPESSNLASFSSKIDRKIIENFENHQIDQDMKIIKFDKL